MALPPPPGPPGRPALPDAAWRAEVGLLRARERRRRFPLEVRVGVPGAGSVAATEPWASSHEHDSGLRFDVAAALVDAWAARGPDPPADGGDRRAAPPPLAWLTRPGDPTLHERDLAWHAACRHAFEAHGMPLVTFRAVTRNGWLDVVTGERRTWKRLRL